MFWVAEMLVFGLYAYLCVFSGEVGFWSTNGNTHRSE